MVRDAACGQLDPEQVAVNSLMKPAPELFVDLHASADNLVCLCVHDGGSSEVMSSLGA